MARKVFLSILGTNPYLEARYYFEEKTGNEKITRFVQTATMEKECRSWGADAAAYIFVTKEAREKNWNDPAQKESKTEEYTGLSKLIEQMNFKFKTEPVPIPEGLTEPEIWKIFEIVFDKLKDGDELYFDITHSFRSLPMLVMVLINYSKFLKNIKVARIYYGAFEKLGPSYQVKSIKVEARFAPVLDITSFSTLQDWTNAANDFVNFGQVRKLTDLTDHDVTPLAKEFKGKNKTVNNLRIIKTHLLNFTENIQTCRGKEILKNNEGVSIYKALNNIKENLISPLNPILIKVKSKLDQFAKPNNIINGFYAVNWCIDNNLIQQGFTILQENIISLVCEEVDIDENKKLNRNIAGSCFKIYGDNLTEEEWKGDAKEYPDIANNILQKSSYIGILSADFNNITNIRNDINHFGYSDSAMKPENLKKALKDYYCNILRKLDIKIQYE